MTNMTTQPNQKQAGERKAQKQAILEQEKSGWLRSIPSAGTDSTSAPDLLAESAQLRQQRDELLAACKAAVIALTDHGRWLPDEYQEAARMARAAIARAEQELGGRP